MRSQTSTEYLIITAVVIIIAVIVIGVLGGIPGIGAGKGEDISDFTLQNEKIGVMNYATSSTNTTFIVRNNAPKVATLEAMWVNNVPCSEGVLPKQLKIGEEIDIICYNIRSLSESPDVNFKWTDSNNVESYTGSDLTSFRDTTTNDCWGQQTNSFWDICTCDDLNLTRFNRTKNYALRYNIDFLEAHCIEYREGAGWVPIGTGTSDAYVGYFNGYGHVVDNLFINRPSTDYVGLFGFASSDSNNYANISNIGVTNVDITANYHVGGLTGYTAYGFYDNVYATGDISGDSYVGGLAGSMYGTSLLNSHAVIDVTGSASSVATAGIIGSGGGPINNTFARGTIFGGTNTGGVVGFSGTLNNVSFEGTVNGFTEVGGLQGYFGSTIRDSYAKARVTCRGGAYCGGLHGGSQSYAGTNTWVNYTDDDATGCNGQDGTTAGVSAANCSP